MNSKQLDQFYTNENISKKLYEYLDQKYSLIDYFLIEPSAGTGSFSDLFHINSIALDLDPKKEYILKQNFIDFEFNNSNKDEQIFTIGNPPFGKNSSLAIKFFNKSAEYSKYIAFIIPKTFKKVSVQNKLNLNFHLIEEIALPENSFIFENNKCDIPCIFQIWENRENKREKINTNIKSKYFDFVLKKDAEFAIRRVGGLAGKLIIDFEKYKEPSHYYIKSKTDLNILKNVFNDSYFALNNMAKNSAGNPSLSKYELIKIIDLMIKSK